MNSKERIEAVFRREKTDKIPVNHRGFSSRIASYILGREAFVGGGIQQWREAKSYWEGWHDEYLERSFKDATDISLVTNQDLMRASYWRYPQAPTKKIDEYTYLYEYGSEENWKVLRYDSRSEQANLFLFRPRELTFEDVRKSVKEEGKRVLSYRPSEENFSFEIKAQKIWGEERVIEIGGVAVGIPILDAAIWFEAMLLDPGLVKAHIANQVEIARKNVEFLSKFGFRYFLGGSDFASEQGPMFSPLLFRGLILPGLKEVSDICHQYEGFHFFASDGNLWPVADALFGESGIDVYFEIDRKAGMDLEELKKKFPDLVLMGNVSSWTLSQGTKEDVKNEVISCLDTAEKYSGIIVGVSNYILPETPCENVNIMLEMLAK